MFKKASEKTFYPKYRFFFLFLVRHLEASYTFWAPIILVPPFGMKAKLPQFGISGNNKIILR